ncbi:class I SAM-dependent methyltransferase [Paenibacillus oralis]|uniref:Class I SAM-dependent methyltransferase n=1 Tax=Paenibacillus oralis TaxID=2490856 RepID=A0A3P3TZX5_9BACL|nr:class I SAM-dependent methyltransferase [Paenibacillus oralis]RRJ63390.1 class I SAM-dependent methyltransferase [Paenibacillus oralis]
MSWTDIYNQNLWIDSGDTSELNEILPLIRKPQEHIIDIGCSFGRISIALAKLGFKVTAIDVADKPLQSIKNNYGHLTNLTTCLINSSELPFADQTTDGCVAINSIYHGRFKDVIEMVNEMYRVLRKEGWVFATFLSTEDWKFGVGEEIEKQVFVSDIGADPGIPHWFAERKDLEALFKGFDMVSLGLKKETVSFPAGPVISAHWKCIARKR